MRLSCLPNFIYCLKSKIRLTEAHSLKCIKKSLAAQDLRADNFRYVHNLVVSHCLSLNIKLKMKVMKQMQIINLKGLMFRKGNDRQYHR